MGDMTDGVKTPALYLFQNFRKQTMLFIGAKMIKSGLLPQQVSGFVWQADLQSLKEFIESNLQLNGPWSTPGG